jgi:hypothetical protein
MLAVIATAGAALLWSAWHSASPERHTAGVTGALRQAASVLPQRSATKAPVGDPLNRYNQATTLTQRLEVIDTFMAIGHHNNPFMLIAALKAPELSVRVHAAEQTAMLSAEAASQVYLHSAMSSDKEVREMTWSLVAPHPMEDKVLVYGNAISQGDPAVVEEALAEMGRTPEKPLFSALLQAASQSQEPSRTARLFTELQAWLLPGSGIVPQFQNLNQLQAWWQSNAQHYDSYMLRLDQ